MKKDKLTVAKKNFNSRLIVGTGKYKSMTECAQAIKLSGAEIVTVAVRRVNISDKKKPLLMDYIDPKKITYLPNTAGCFNSEEALRTLRLAREIGGWKLVKLEVLGDKKNLFPDMIETLKSTEVLTNEGFKVMDSNRKEKQQNIVEDYQIYTSTGWSNITRVIRHKTVKNIYRVTTHTGMVDVTEDHSLLDENSKIVKPI